MGAGIGFAGDGSNNLKNNRNVLKKKGAFQRIKDNTFLNSKKVYQFKESTPEQLKQIRIKLHQHNKERTRKLITIMMLISLAIITIFYLLMY
jgi:translation initiation factor 1 (eIF-1/SUI1)